MYNIRLDEHRLTGIKTEWLRKSIVTTLAIMLAVCIPVYHLMFNIFELFVRIYEGSKFDYNEMKYILSRIWKGR